MLKSTWTVMNMHFKYLMDATECIYYFLYYQHVPKVNVTSQYSHAYFKFKSYQFKNVSNKQYKDTM